MSTSSDENESGAAVGIGDDQLPEDLVPGEDNPLAEAPEDGKGVDDLLEDGKPAAEDPDDPAGDGPGAVES